MNERFYDSLELNKILEMLSKECSNEKTKKMALGIKPCSDLYTVKKETGKTAEALELSVRYGTPNFYNINDVSTYIKRAEAGGVLSLGELIQIRRLTTGMSSARTRTLPFHISLKCSIQTSICSRDWKRLS